MVSGALGTGSGRAAAIGPGEVVERLETVSDRGSSAIGPREVPWLMSASERRAAIGSCGEPGEKPNPGGAAAA